MFCSTVTQQVSEQRRGLVYRLLTADELSAAEGFRMLVLCVYSMLLGLTGGIEVGVVEGGMGVGGLQAGAVCRIWGMG